MHHQKAFKEPERQPDLVSSPDKVEINNNENYSTFAVLKKNLFTLLVLFNKLSETKIYFTDNLKRR